MQKTGIIIILAGIFIIISALAFVDKYNPKAGFVLNLTRMVVVWEKPAATQLPLTEEEKIGQAIARDLFGPEKQPGIPYRYFFLAGLALILTGAILIIGLRRSSS